MVAYCDWDPTTPVTETVNLDGNGTTLMPLPSLFVTAVTGVVVTDQYGNSYTATIDQPAVPAGSDVGWSQNGLLEWHPWRDSRYPTWPEGQQNIAVTYSGGYPTTPSDLDAALTHLSGRIPAMTGATSKRLGSASVTVAQQIANGGLLLVEQMVFDRYRLPKVR